MPPPGAMTPRVHAVIMNWNGRHWLERCLPSLLAQDYTNLVVIVVDCNSHDGSAAWLQEHYPSVRLHVIPFDCAPQYANNLAVREYECDWVCLLNNDVILPPDCIRRMVEAALAAPPDTIINPVQLTWEGEYYSAGYPLAMVECVYPFLRWLLRPLAAAPDHAAYPCTACCLVARSTYLRFPLNEDMFMYDEIEWIWRIQAAGGDLEICEDLGFFHAGHATVGTKSARQLRIIGRNDAAALWVNATPSLLLPMLPFYIAYYLRFTLALLVKRGPVRALWSGLRECFRMHRVWNARRLRQRSLRLRSGWFLFRRALAGSEYVRVAKSRWRQRWPEPWVRPAGEREACARAD